jgi:hypothetical protein
MAKLIVVCLMIMNSATVFGQYAEFSFIERVHKFEPAVEGELLECTFEFENTGDVPLIISKYEVECTCTVVTFSKEPVAPGATGTVHVSFDSKGKIGWQYRKILLYSNVKKSPYSLEIRVKILNE